MKRTNRLATLNVTGELVADHKANSVLVVVLEIAKPDAPASTISLKQWPEVIHARVVVTTGRVAVLACKQNWVSLSLRASNEQSACAKQPRIKWRTQQHVNVCMCRVFTARARG